MQLINVNGTYVNLDCLAFARPDRGIDGKIKLDVTDKIERPSTFIGRS
jgi:hypothetical protein